MPDSAHTHLLIDLDGTLLDGKGGLSARNHAALHRAAGAGLVLVLATGRTYHSLLRVTGGLELPPFHMITNGGAVGLTPGAQEVRFTGFMPRALWREAAAQLEQAGLAPVVFAHRHPEPPLFHTNGAEGDAHHAAYVTRNAAWRRDHQRLGEARIADVVEVAALGREPSFGQASARVLARMAGRARCHSMMLVLDGNRGRITEFFAPETSKWRAFQGLFPEAGARPERVIAIGDEANDLEMIRGAGLGIAMGNATPELRAAADHVAPDHDRDGVAQVLETLLEGRSLD